MKFNENKLALSTGLTTFILSLVFQLMGWLMNFRCFLHPKGIMHPMKMMHFGRFMHLYDKAGACVMSFWGIFLTSILTFILGFLAGWLIAFFYNKLTKK